MKKILTLFAVLSSGIIFSGLNFKPTTNQTQDNVILVHTNYTSTFSKSKRYPVMVEWWATKQKVSCATPLKRKDNFKPDSLLPKYTDLANDYKGSGFDRGHMMPAADNLCQTQQVQDECFYFSNMAAQYHRLNAGDWKSLETFERVLASEKDSIHVWCGNIGEITKIGSVSVPKQCWKVMYVVKTKTWMSFLFNNDKSTPDGYENNKVDIKIIESLTGFKFLK
jgi:endonuclease G